MRWLSPILFCLLVICTVVAPPARAADDFLRNAWGIYAAPTTHTVTSAGGFYEGPTNTSLEFGAYYTRFVTEKFSFRVELRLADRRADVSLSRVDETFLEVPFLLQGDVRSRMGERELRVSAGGGVYYAALLGQDYYHEYPLHEVYEAGDSQRLGFLVDGGVTMEYIPRHAVFLRFRMQQDGYIFGEQGGVFAESYFAYGFNAGFEWAF